MLNLKFVEVVSLYRSFTLALTLLASLTIGSAAWANGDQGNDHSSVNVAFFGAAKANSFTLAEWRGVKNAVKKFSNGGQAHFFGGRFQASTQINQIKDANTSGVYDVYVIMANNGAALIPAVKAALAKGAKVVAVFIPIGTKFNTAKPQIPGLISFVDVPTYNGMILGKMARHACSAKKIKPCRVAYFQGLPSLSVDTARTKAVLRELKKDKNISIVATPVGGYTHRKGRAAAQNLLTAHPNVDVVIGSSQALEGAAPILARSNGKITLIGNGGSTQAVKSVKNGSWFSTYYLPVQTMGYDAAELGIKAALGQKVPHNVNVAHRYTVYGTKKSLKNKEGQYRD